MVSAKLLKIKLLLIVKLIDYEKNLIVGILNV
jgi:hypothetical protein